MNKAQKDIKREYFADCEDIIKDLPFLYESSSKDRMFGYLWYIIDDITVNSNNCIEGECKFGETWIKPGVYPLKHITNYVRKDQGKRKDKWDEGKVKLLAIWDLSEYSIKYDKFHMHSKVDDHLRNRIGFVKQSEVHCLDPIEMFLKVNEVLSSEDSPLPTVGLKAGQIRTLLITIGFYNEGARVILGDLYARFGKTIFTLALAKELNWKLIVVASYVKTSFRSFENDISKWNQFKTMVCVNSADPKYKEKIQKLLKEGKQVVVFLSLCNGSNRNGRIEYLLSQNVSTGLIIDEADFGAHKKNQADPLKEFSLKNENCKVFLMTGTNTERAAAAWPIDEMVLETYYESLIDKETAAKTLNLN